MKADSKTHNEVIAVLKGLFDAYEKRDIESMLTFLAPDSDVVVIGSGEDERAIGPEEFGKSAKRDWVQSENASIQFKDAEVSTAGTVSWFAADVTFQFTIEGKESRLPGRMTGVLEKRNGKLLLMQLHFSTPSQAQVEGESWPHEH